MSEEFEPDSSDELEISQNTGDQDDAALDHDDDDGLDNEQTGEDGEGEGGDDDLEDVEWEGKTVRVPPNVKAALMRTADYTRKTQEVADQRRALDEAAQRLNQQAQTSQEIDTERVNLAVIETQLKALEKLDWDKLEEEDPDEANRLTRQQIRLRSRADQLRAGISTKQNDLDLARQRTANDQRATAVKECVDVLKRDIKGWNNDLAVQIGKFAVEKMGFSPQQIDGLTHAPTIKALHGAFLADKAARSTAAQRKLEAADKTAPVRRPGGGASPNSRRTTDASGDKLSTDEWIRREQARLTAKRKNG